MGSTTPIAILYICTNLHGHIKVQNGHLGALSESESTRGFLNQKEDKSQNFLSFTIKGSRKLCTNRQAKLA